MTNFAVLITSNAIGKDAAVLGEKLMGSYLYALAEAEVGELPTHILFLNTGVTLLLDETSTSQTLEVLQDKGVKLLACGTCIDYFQLKEKINVGEISNMYAIRDIMAQADKVITLG